MAGLRFRFVEFIGYPDAHRSYGEEDAISSRVAPEVEPGRMFGGPDMTDSDGTGKVGTVTVLLHQAQAGQQTARSELYQFVFDQLHRLASRQMRGQRDPMLEPTLVANDAYLKLVNLNRIQWKDRGHFYAVAATAIRWFLVDHARGRIRQKRQPRGGAVPWTDEIAAPPSVRLPGDVDVLELDRALSELAEFAPRQAKIVHLRFFAGLSLADIASLVGVSRGTVYQDWEKARGWLRIRLSSEVGMQ